MIGTTYESPSTGQQFKLIEIIEKNGKDKLKEPIYLFAYINRPGTFTCYLEHVKRSLDFKVWKELK